MPRYCSLITTIINLNVRTTNDYFNIKFLVITQIAIIAALYISI